MIGGIRRSLLEIWGKKGNTTSMQYRASERRKKKEGKKKTSTRFLLRRGKRAGEWLTKYGGGEIDQKKKRKLHY